MRVLLVGNIAPWDVRAGGGAWVCHDLANHLSARGLEIHVVYVGRVAVPLTDVRYTVHQAMERRRLAQNVIETWACSRRLFRSLRFDAVHTTSAEAAGVVLGLPKGVGLLVTSHHPALPALLRPKFIAHPVSAVKHLRKMQRFYLERLCLRRADRVFAPSRNALEMFRSGGYVDSDLDIPIIHNGIGAEWFEGHSLGDESRPTVLFVGRMDRQKGLDVLLRAATRLSTRVTYRIVGAGWQLEENRDLAHSLGIGQRVEFLGHRTLEEIRAEMRRATVFALPSRNENFGLVLLEAAAMRVPIVTTAVGAVPELFRDGHNALLVEPEDPEMLAAALDRVLSDSGLRKRLTEAAVAVAETHRWEGIAGRIEGELRIAAVLAKHKDAARVSQSSP